MEVVKQIVLRYKAPKINFFQKSWHIGLFEKDMYKMKLPAQACFGAEEPEFLIK